MFYLFFQVTTIYGESLKRVSGIEPSLDRLRAVANFLYSAFVRVQNDGLLSFAKFWRSTYHQYEGVSKKDYPLAIRACLKAWSDVCDDSFADDISLGSESQSLVSVLFILRILSVDLRFLTLGELHYSRFATFTRERGRGHICTL